MPPLIFIEGINYKNDSKQYEKVDFEQYALYLRENPYRDFKIYSNLLDFTLDTIRKYARNSLFLIEIHLFHKLNYYFLNLIIRNCSLIHNFAEYIYRFLKASNIF